MGEIFVMKTKDGYESFEYHTIAVGKCYNLERLESRSLLIDRPRYTFQQSLWIAYSYILKSKIEQHYFDEKVCVIAEHGENFEIATQKILNPACWHQITKLKNFGTIDEGQTLYGTIYLKKIKNFFEKQDDKRTITGINWFDRTQDEIKLYVVETIGLEKIMHLKTTNVSIEENLKQKFPKLSRIFIRELVTNIRKDFR